MYQKILKRIKINNVGTFSNTKFSKGLVRLTARIKNKGLSALISINYLQNCLGWVLLNPIFLLWKFIVVFTWVDRLFVILSPWITEKLREIKRVLKN
jgi:hypothetical protein